jgi:hypothetical protein
MTRDQRGALRITPRPRWVIVPHVHALESSALTSALLPKLRSLQQDIFSSLDFSHEVAARGITEVTAESPPSASFTTMIGASVAASQIVILQSPFETSMIDAETAPFAEVRSTE